MSESGNPGSVGEPFPSEKMGATEQPSSQLIDTDKPVIAVSEDIGVRPESPPLQPPGPDSQVRLKGLEGGDITSRCKTTKRSFSAPPIARTHLMTLTLAGGVATDLGREAPATGFRRVVRGAHDFLHPSQGDVRKCTAWKG